MPRTDSVEQIMADADYWNELARALGWTLHGFTFREHASFVTPHLGDSLVNLTGRQRDDILAMRDAIALPRMETNAFEDEEPPV